MHHGIFSGSMMDDVWDVVRLFDVLVGIMIIPCLLAIAVLRAHEHRWSNVSLVVGLVVFLVSGIGTEFSMFGDHATYVLYTNTAGVIASCVAVVLWLREVRTGKWDETIMSSRSKSRKPTKR